jgi:hypothetical protein
MWDCEASFIPHCPIVNGCGDRTFQQWWRPTSFRRNRCADAALERQERLAWLDAVNVGWCGE